MDKIMNFLLKMSLTLFFIIAFLDISSLCFRILQYYNFNKYGITFISIICTYLFIRDILKFLKSKIYF